MRWPVSPDLKGSEREKSLRWNLWKPQFPVTSFEDVLRKPLDTARETPVIQCWTQRSWLDSRDFQSLDAITDPALLLVLMRIVEYLWISCVRAFKHSLYKQLFNEWAWSIDSICRQGHLRLVPRPWPKSYFCETCFVTIPRMPFAWTIASSARRYVTSQGGLHRFFETLESLISSLLELSSKRIPADRGESSPPSQSTSASSASASLSGLKRLIGSTMASSPFEMAQHPQLLGGASDSRGPISAVGNAQLGTWTFSNA